MALSYANLDERTRQLMLDELELDLARGALEISPRLNRRGVDGYPAMFREAVRYFDDGWLARELRAWRYLRTYELRRSPSGDRIIVKVPVTAADTLAEGQFNLYYMRALCIRAIQDDVPEVEVYRGKAVKQPRPESEALVGRRLPAAALLADLRRAPDEGRAFGLPAGPNSGLTIRLPVSAP